MAALLLEDNHDLRLAQVEHYVRSYELNLPRTADYFQWDPQFTPQSHGPFSRRVGSFDAQLTSRDWCIVGDVVTDSYVLLGALSAMRSFTYFTAFKEQGRFRRVMVCQPEIGDTELPETVVILQGSDWRDLLKQYSAMVAEAMSVGTIDSSTNRIGYCSWYYHYQSVTELEFMQNLAVLERHRPVFPARYVQIDDGYHSCHGDWLTHHANWPTALHDIVKRIRNAGFEAGIWTMPFLAATSSNLCNDNPDWFVRDEFGAAITVEGWSPEPHNVWACLDVTHRQVQQHLRSVYGSLYDMGFRYFKLDGLGFCAPRGQRQNGDHTGVSAFRMGLQLIKESVGDSVVLACGAILPCVGLVDQCRISPDTGTTWQPRGLPTHNRVYDPDKSEPADPCLPSLENALKVSLSHWWMYDTYFRADPDVVVARQENTETTVGNARMSALMAVLTGVAFTSDRLDEMSEDRIRLLHLASLLRMREIRPMDWRTRSWPHVYEGVVDGKPAMAVFNLSDTAVLYDLEDYWRVSVSTEMLHPLGQVGNVLSLPGNDAALLVAGDGGVCEMEVSAHV